MFKKTLKWIVSWLEVGPNLICAYLRWLRIQQDNNVSCLRYKNSLLEPENDEKDTTKPYCVKKTGIFKICM